MVDPKRIVFMGTPDFSVPILQALLDAGHDIAAVYCQPPRRAGRGKKERLTAVHAYAEKLGLEVRTPLNFKDPEDVQHFTDLNADIAVVVAYGLILPQSILDAPKLGCLNIHASLLPRWRGAAPIHRAIMAGDAKTGVCIMQMDTGLDTGDVLSKMEIAISQNDTTGSLHDRLSDLGAKAIVNALDELEGLDAVPQDTDGVSYAQKISKEEAEIDWTDCAKTVDQKIRGLSPFPGAWFKIDDERIKVLQSKYSKTNGIAGEVLNENLLVACGAGSVDLLSLQRAGKGVLSRIDFMRGFPITKGVNLLNSQ